MTRETAQKYRAEINAFADGKVIQRQFQGCGWEDDPCPCWLNHLQYRIKPESKEWWIPASCIRAFNFPTIDPGEGDDFIHVREVL
jgi:expansin (peptidoglycan-binding protein)